MISENKARIDISLNKNSVQIIDTFCKAIGKSKSEFIEEVCLTFIGDVVRHQKEMQKEKKGQA